MMFEQTVDICYFCGINHEEIEHPYRMGGSDECECYEKTDPKQEPEFEYPKKETPEECLRIIADLCIDYDGFNTVDGLKSLIDDIYNMATKRLKENQHFKS